MFVLFTNIPIVVKEQFQSLTLYLPYKYHSEASRRVFEPSYELKKDHYRTIITAVMHLSK